MRAAIYARYSSSHQRDASIEDQVEVCRRYAVRQGWDVVDIYDDPAESGGSAFRPGYQRLLADAETRRFDIVLCEALDRLSRRLADIAGLHDQLSFMRIRLFAVNAGEITPMHVGMMGTMAQMYLSDLGEKTRRGQLGRALKGMIPGGKAFGYDVVGSGDKGARGARSINEVEAQIVRRIFTEYANGRSPRAIAKTLNEESIRGPGGRSWGDTTIRGQVDRGTGIVNNAIYAGRLEWNRCSYIKDPRTGKRVARINPPEMWEIVEIPELRIIPDDLWERVKTRQLQVRTEIGRDASGQPLNRAHRRKFMFSGLLTCGICGGGYIIMGKDRYGCATHRAKGTCGNTKTILRQEIEARVLAGLKERLMAPELVETFARAFHEEMNRALRDAEQSNKANQTELDAVIRKIDSLMKAIEEGMYSPSMKERMAELEARKALLEQVRASEPDRPSVRIHPNLSRIYAEKVAKLEDALYEPSTKDEAMAVIRSLIDQIVLTPIDEGLAAELHGDLAEILRLCEGDGPKRQRPPADAGGHVVSVVAGARTQYAREFRREVRLSLRSGFYQHTASRPRALPGGVAECDSGRPRNESCFHHRNSRLDRPP